ncbi:MAG: calcium/sodium antiporter [Treponema sp.]|nr:calcium/sodium antiporter [Treponema sp.]
MHLLRDAFLLALGFVVLVQSAKLFVNASVSIARRLKIPNLVIGLTVVAMGTSAPELMISVSAALAGSGDLAVANVVGSNIFNLVFIIGFCAALYPVNVNINEISRDFWVSIGATVFLFFIVIIFHDTIPRFASFTLLAGFAVYMISLVRHTLKHKIDDAVSIDNADSETGQSGKKPKPLVLYIFLAVLGAALIVVGGEITVLSAVSIAQALGVTERVIGLTIVAMGTSLPELVTTIIACKKKEGEFAVGFIVGSNIFNMMFVLGLAGTITPLAIERNTLFDIAVLTGGCLLFYLFAKTGKRITRLEGIFMAALYAGYMAVILLL